MDKRWERELEEVAYISLSDKLMKQTTEVYNIKSPDKSWKRGDEDYRPIIQKPFHNIGNSCGIF